MITKAEAIELARKAIEGKIKLQGKAEPAAELRGDSYVVTFPHVTPPRELGPDFDARVTIEATSGHVADILAGS